MWRQLLITTVFCVILLHSSAIPAEIIDLDDAFMQDKEEGQWLVMFYAPWCGHCKKLQPTYEQVAHHFRDSKVKIAQLDATQHKSVADQCSIRGFPTITFFENGNELEFKGERTQKSIVEFVTRMNGPPVRDLPLDMDIYKLHPQETYFIFGGDETGMLRIYFTQVATFARHSNYFYSCPYALAQRFFKISKTDAKIYAIREGRHYAYRGAELVADIKAWTRQMRLSVFPQVGLSGLLALGDIDKIMVVMVGNYSKGLDSLDVKARAVVRELAKKEEPTLRQFQFLWSSDKMLPNTLTAWWLELPILIVYNITSRNYYLPMDFSLGNMTESSLRDWLLHIEADEVTPLGNTGVSGRLQQIWFNMLSGMLDVYNESMFVFSLIFMLPGMVIAVICFLACSSEHEYEDPLVAEELAEGQTDEEEEEASRELENSGHPKSE